MATDPSSALNEILFSKKQYDQGNKVWAATNAKQYYGQLDPTEASQVHNMNTQQLTDYMNAKKNPTSAGGGASAPAGGGNSQSYIDQLNSARLSNTIAALGKSRDNALSNLGSEKSAIQPQYYDQRNQVSAGAQQQSRNFAEYMANRGGGSSGTNAQATLMNNMTTQGNLGSLGRQEAQAYTDIARRTSDLQNAYQSDVASATSGAEADKMQALLTDYYNQQQQALQVAGITGIYNGQKTLAGQQFDYGKTRDTVADSQWKQTFDQNKAQYGEQFAYQKARDAISDENDKKAFDEQVKQSGLDNAVQWYSAQTSRNSSNNASSNAAASLAWAKDPKNPDNIYKAWQYDPKNPDNIPKPDTPAGDNFNLDDYKGFINNSFYTDQPVDPNDPFSAKQKVFNSTGARKYILGLGMPDDKTDQLLKIYGLPTN